MLSGSLDALRLGRKGGFVLALLKVVTMLVFLAVVGRVSILYAQLYLRQYFNKEDAVVPKLVGVSLKDANDVARDRRLHVEIIREAHDNNFPVDYVIAQDPPPDSTVKSGRTIELVISKGPVLGRCPDLVSKDLMDVNFILQRTGYAMGKRIYYLSDNVRENSVIAQTPPGGAEVGKGSQVDLLISRGAPPAEKTAPDLVGARLESARAALDILGFKIGTLAYDQNASEDNNRVLKQDPVQGTPVIPGATFTLIVNRKAQGASLPAVAAGTSEVRAATGLDAPPDVKPSERVEIVHFVVPPADSAKEVVIWLEDEQGSREIYRNTHYPTEEIDRTVKGFGKMNAKIYLDGTQFQTIELGSGGH